MNKYNCPNTCIDENTGKVRRRMPAANGLIPSHNGSLAFICRQPLDFTFTALPLQRKPRKTPSHLRTKRIVSVVVTILLHH